MQVQFFPSQAAVAKGQGRLFQIHLLSLVTRDQQSLSGTDFAGLLTCAPAPVVLLCPVSASK